MVQYIERNENDEAIYRLKYYSKLIYNIECKNQQTGFGTNMFQNIENTDKGLKQELLEFGNQHGITRIEITIYNIDCKERIETLYKRGLPVIEEA